MRCHKRGRDWLQAYRDGNRRKPKDLLVFTGGIVYHSIWLHPRISLGVSVILLAVLTCLLIAA